MNINQTTQFTITLNGTVYTFADTHPVTDLIAQLKGEQQALSMWQERLDEGNARILDIENQIIAHCTSGV